MRFYSTKNRSVTVDLRQAVLEGLAPDNGLYMPDTIPQLPPSFFRDLSSKSFPEMAYDVAKNLIGDDVDPTELRMIVNNTVAFKAPLVKLETDVYALELFHGPTLAFKDFGARFLSGLLGYFAKQQQKEITILVATSGDTGSAVASGFLNVAGTRVVILYPSGKVSDLQEKQFTTLGGNVTAIEVEGTFDDCQRLVKTAFLDGELRNKLFLTSANSINIARLIPQTFYYFFAVAQLKSKKPVVFSVPSGNFGNLTAGLMARRMGLPINRFVAVTNINDVVPEYLRTKNFVPRPSTQTISNAMDVGNPSNFDRMLDLYGHDFETLTDDLVGFRVSDEETRNAIRTTFEDDEYILDPHGAVGYLGLKTYLKDHPGKQGVFLETAHPGKFREVVEEVIGKEVELPERLKAFLSKEKRSVRMGKEFGELRELLLRG
jgi:threonine synthase